MHSWGHQHMHMPLMMHPGGSNSPPGGYMVQGGSSSAARGGWQQPQNPKSGGSHSNGRHPGGSRGPMQGGRGNRARRHIMLNTSPGKQRSQPGWLTHTLPRSVGSLQQRLCCAGLVPHNVPHCFAETGGKCLCRDVAVGGSRGQHDKRLALSAPESPQHVTAAALAANHLARHEWLVSAGSTTPASVDNRTRLPALRMPCTCRHPFLQVTSRMQLWRSLLQQ